MIVVCSLRAAPEQVRIHAPSHVVSILSPASVFPEFQDLQHHLKLTFHDVAAAVPGLSAPGEHDMMLLLKFLREWDRSTPLVIHCWAGISRSTAAAYIAMNMLMPDRDEMELANMLREASASATPNPMLVRLADDALGRQGKMVRAIQKIGRGADAFEGSTFQIAME